MCRSYFPENLQLTDGTRQFHAMQDNGRYLQLQSAVANYVAETKAFPQHSRHVSVSFHLFQLPGHHVRCVSYPCHHGLGVLWRNPSRHFAAPCRWWPERPCLRTDFSPWSSPAFTLTSAMTLVKEGSLHSCLPHPRGK